jgi:DNA-binding transcriptional LysR family regulator
MLWITREEGSSTRLAVEDARVRMGLHPVRTLELPSWEAVKLAVADTVGIAAISWFAIRHELAAGRLVRLHVGGWRVTRTIALVTAHDVPLTPPARKFLDQLRAVEFTPSPSDAETV